MRVDLRVKHDVEARKAAIGLFELGHGYKSAAIALSLPAEAVRRWQEIYRAFGSEVLLRMDGKQGRYTYEQKVAAASAVVDGGMTKTEAMAAFGIMSMSPLKKWCAPYRRGGAEALRPRPKGRPSGSRARPRTREEELEERCRRLEAEVAYLKNYAPWSRGTDSDQGEGRSGRGPARRGARARAPARMRRAQAVDLLLRPRAPAEAHAPRAPGGGRRDLLAHRQRLRAPADSDVPQGGRGGRDSRQDRAQDDARDGDSLRDQTRDGPPRVQLVQGRRRQNVRERDREGFRRRGPVAEAGDGRHRVQGGWR